MSRQGVMRPLSIAMLVLLWFPWPALARPGIEHASLAEMRILDAEAKLLFKSGDKETMDFAIKAMKRASEVGSNTFGWSLDHYLVFMAADGTEASRWFFDPRSGHFARVTPPKLLLYRFKRADLEALRKKTGIKVDP